MSDDAHYAIAGKVGRALSMGSGLLSILLGIVNASRISASWCEENEALVDAGLSPFRCIGGALAWNTGQADSVIFDVNARWRFLFSLRPDQLMIVWTPVILGIITVMAHIGTDPSLPANLAASGWGHTSFWLVFVAVFGHLAYAGNMGIVTGFMVCFAAFVCMVVRFVAPDSSPRMQLTENSVPESRLPEGCGAATKWITVVLAALAAIMTLVTGCAVLYDLLPDDCDSDVNDCVGPGLFWIGSDSSLNSVDPVNFGLSVVTGAPIGADLWGALFNLSPSVFLANFGPILFGLAGIAAQLSENSFPTLTSSWTMIFVWHMVQAFFANLGYGGNLGVFTGFLSIVTAVFALLTGLSRNPPEQRRTGVDAVGILSGLGQRASSAVAHKS